ncbi:MAG: aminomethyl-transferring glycine dehydrogenase subunit GcvPA [Candidatus Hodarchaeota archaeon]
MTIRLTDASDLVFSCQTFINLNLRETPENRDSHSSLTWRKRLLVGAVKMQEKHLANPFLPHTAADIQEMLSFLGLNEIDQLFADIPEKVRFNKKLDLPESHSEAETERHILELLQFNLTADDGPFFLGGSIYPDHIPAVVQYLIQRGEFLTSYTPYAPEISQGMLQALFEYQSLICELTGMDAANSSMYDWGTALGEAARMCARITKKGTFLVPKAIHPDRMATLIAFAKGASIKIEAIPYSLKSGQLEIEKLENSIDRDCCGIYIENPNLFGVIETEAPMVGQLAQKLEIPLVVGADPISLGILTPPGDYGASIVVGEGQSLGLPMSFGGPSFGIFACKYDRKMIRNMPGRLIGMTKTEKSNRRSFCMTLQTREQHIRREKATSNICTNNALCAVASAIYLSLLGPKGIQEHAKLLIGRNRLLAERTNAIDGFKAPVFGANVPHFRDHVIQLEKPGKTAADLNRSLLKAGIIGGKILTHDFQDLGEALLFSVNNRQSLNDYQRLEDELGRFW